MVVVRQRLGGRTTNKNLRIHQTWQTDLIGYGDYGLIIKILSNLFKKKSSYMLPENSAKRVRKVNTYRKEKFMAKRI